MLVPPYSEGHAASSTIKVYIEFEAEADRYEARAKIRARSTKEALTSLESHVTLCNKLTSEFSVLLAKRTHGHQVPLAASNSSSLKHHRHVTCSDIA